MIIKKKSYVILFLLISFAFACKKKNESIDFHLNSLTLKSTVLNNLPKQNLYLKVIQIKNFNEIELASTNKYPSNYTLPVKFGLEKSISMNFYKNDYKISLYGDSSGCLSKNTINIKDYKILYPLDMDTEDNNTTIILSGTWK